MSFVVYSAPSERPLPPISSQWPSVSPSNTRKQSNRWTCMHIAVSLNCTFNFCSFVTSNLLLLLLARPVPRDVTVYLELQSVWPRLLNVSGVLCGVFLQGFLVFFVVCVIWVVLLLKLLPFFRLLVEQEFNDFLSTLFLPLTAFGTIILQSFGDVH